MPRLAVGGAGIVASAGRGVARRARRRPGSAAGVVATCPLTPLAPAVRAGWSMPRLDGVTEIHRVWRDERIMATVGRSLIGAGIVDPALWESAGRDPFLFVLRAIKEFVGRHGGSTSARNFTLHLALSANLGQYAERSGDPNAADLFLTLEPSEAGYLVLGPALAALEREHPRLPVTFFHLVSGAMNRWVRTYDFRDARDHVERLRDWYSADPDCESYALPDVETSIPASMRAKALGVSEVKRLLPALRSPCKAWMIRALELSRLSARRARPRFTQAIEEQLYDCNPPLPSLLVVFGTGDNIEACFDAESQGMLETTPEPNLVISFNGTDVRSTKQAFATLSTACHTLAAAGELIDILKKEAPWSSN